MKKRQGLVMVNTGPGKGKTTAALGAALRAAGHGLKILIIQFIKNRVTGELKTLKLLPGVTFKQLGLGMFRNRQPNDRDRAAARQAWEEAVSESLSGDFDLVILDEICPALHFELLTTDEVLDFIKRKPRSLHLILTGRYCPEEIIQAADTVTYMEAVRHHLTSGCRSQPGVEY